MTPPSLVSIWIKRYKHGPMDAMPMATLIAGKGIAGNANQGGRRQVTIIEEEVWSRLMQEVGGALPPSTRRANLMVRGLALRDTRGRTLAVGGTEIRILGETRPCAQMDEALPGLKEAMSPAWGGGAFGEVIVGGEIRVGDPAVWKDEP